jgi:hypothetical protein
VAFFKVGKRGLNWTTFEKGMQAYDDGTSLSDPDNQLYWESSDDDA